MPALDVALGLRVIGPITAMRHALTFPKRSLVIEALTAAVAPKRSFDKPTTWAAIGTLRTLR